ncbi:MAG: hypothetical protein GXP54_03430, partial [Deltaproteobacteria bacterium]|nr:hypothetical protein [Deltaproteobacteria bacterium]
ETVGELEVSVKKLQREIAGFKTLKAELKKAVAENRKLKDTLKSLKADQKAAMKTLKSEWKADLRALKAKVAMKPVKRNAK